MEDRRLLLEFVLDSVETEGCDPSEVDLDAVDVKEVLRVIRSGAVLNLAKYKRAAKAEKGNFLELIFFFF